VRQVGGVDDREGRSIVVRDEAAEDILGNVQVVRAEIIQQQDEDAGAFGCGPEEAKRRHGIRRALLVTSEASAKSPREALGTVTATSAIAPAARLARSQLVSNASMRVRKGSAGKGLTALRLSVRRCGDDEIGHLAMSIDGAAELESAGPLDQHAGQCCAVAGTSEASIFERVPSDALLPDCPEALASRHNFGLRCRRARLQTRGQSAEH
jgi:hypothetical protein